MGNQISRQNAEALFEPQVMTEIIEGAVKQSAVLSMFRRLPNMTSNKTKMRVLDALPIAYWVDADTNNGRKKLTSQAWDNKYITAAELAVIVPIKEDVLDDADYDIWADVQPRISEAFGKKIDAAVIVGDNKPKDFRADMLSSIRNAGATITQGTNTLYQAINEAMEKVEGSGYNPSGIIGGVGIKGKFRMMLDTTGQPIKGTEIDTLPKAYIDNGAWNNALSQMIIGDMKQAVYAIRQDVTYKLLDQAVIQDPSTGTILYNLAQDDMVALRVTMRLGWEIPNPINSLSPDESTRFPFASIDPASAFYGLVIPEEHEELLKGDTDYENGVFRGAVKLLSDGGIIDKNWTVDDFSRYETNEDGSSTGNKYAKNGENAAYIKEALGAVGMDENSSVVDLLSRLCKNYRNMSEEEKEAWSKLGRPKKETMEKAVLSAERDGVNILFREYNNNVRYHGESENDNTYEYKPYQGTGSPTPYGIRAFEEVNTPAEMLSFGSHGTETDSSKIYAYAGDDEARDTITSLLADSRVGSALVLGNLTELDYDYISKNYGVSRENVDMARETFYDTLTAFSDDIMYGQGLDEGWKKSLDGILSSMGRMVPSIVTSTVTSPFLPGASSILPAFEAIYYSAAGSAYEGALMEGKSADEAATYAKIQGESEFLSEIVLGGLGKGVGLLGGKVLKPLEKYVSKLAKGTFGKILSGGVKLLSNSLEEGFEEYVQEMLDPLYRNAAFGENNKMDVFAGENFEAAFYGIATSLLTSGVTMSVDGAFNAVRKLMPETVIRDGKITPVGAALVTAATFGEDSYSAKVLDKIGVNVDYDTGIVSAKKDSGNAKTSARNLIKLYEAIGNDMSWTILSAASDGGTLTDAVNASSLPETAKKEILSFEKLDKVTASVDASDISQEEKRDLYKAIGFAKLYENIADSKLDAGTKKKIREYGKLNAVAQYELRADKKATDAVVSAISGNNETRYNGMSSSRAFMFDENDEPYVVGKNNVEFGYGTTIERAPVRMLARPGQIMSVSVPRDNAKVNNVIKHMNALLSPYGINVADRTVRFYQTEGGVMPNSFFDPTTNTIYLTDNVTTEKAAMAKLGHEIVEAVVSGGESSFVSDCIEVMKETGHYSEETLNAVMKKYTTFFAEKLINDYAEAGRFGEEARAEAIERAYEKITPEYAQKEMVCDFVGELAEGGELISKLKASKKSGVKAVLAKIYEAVKKVMDFFTRRRRIEGNEEFTQLEKLENILRSFVAEQTEAQIGKSEAVFKPADGVAFSLDGINNTSTENVENSDDKTTHSVFNIPAEHVVIIDKYFTREEVSAALQMLEGKKLHNDIENVDAQINSRQRNKLVSGAARDSSIRLCDKQLYRITIQKKKVRKYYEKDYFRNFSRNNADSIICNQCLCGNRNEFVQIL